jgi:hypothetical protein
MPSVPPPRSSMPSLPPDSTPSYQPVLDARIVEAPPSSHGFAPAPPRSQEASAYTAIGALLAAVAIFAIGAIGYFLWRARAHAPAPPPVVTAPAAKSAQEPPPIDTSITVEAVEPVMFHVSPDNAVLIVDGAEQAPGVRAVTRKPGTPVVVIMRAPGFEDATVTIDDAYTNRSVVVALRPTKRRASDPPKRNDPLPANPY